MYENHIEFIKTLNPDTLSLETSNPALSLFVIIIIIIIIIIIVVSINETVVSATFCVGIANIH